MVPGIPTSRPDAQEGVSIIGINKEESDNNNDAAKKSSSAVVMLQRTVAATAALSSSDDPRNLSLLFLGCEAQRPYGPYEHTARLFLDLMVLAVEEMKLPYDFTISLQVYHVSKGHFPTTSDVEDSDGVILPGSYNSAYEVGVQWIDRLKELIQTQLVSKAKPALGVCFGHQIYAQSFESSSSPHGSGGSAVKCPAGAQAGRKSLQLTKAGRHFFSSSSSTEDVDGDKLDLYYSHGDMVQQLPPQAVSLGGNDKVPIQAAVYYDGHNPPLQQPGQDEHQQLQPRPIAITFQAHPEYGSSTSIGLEQTLRCILELMTERGDITADVRDQATKDAIDQFVHVQRQSIDVMKASGKLLGWFP